MAVKKVGITLPEEVLTDIDELSEKNFSSRSHTIARVWIEWKAFKAQQVVGKSTSDLRNPGIAIAA